MKILIFSIIALLFFSCEVKPNKFRDFPHSIDITAFIKSNKTHDEVPVYVSLEEIKRSHKNFNANAFIITRGKDEIASQLVDLDHDGEFDHILQLLSFGNDNRIPLKIRFAENGKKSRVYKQRAHAELSRKSGGIFQNNHYVGGKFISVSHDTIPTEHVPHSEYYRYEGPGWESDKVGYRFYLDWRNANDIFGKKISAMVLPRIGHDTSDSYHEMNDWGQDIFKVGTSLGIGSIGIWAGEKTHLLNKTDLTTWALLADGPLLATMKTLYMGTLIGGKKFNVSSWKSITGGSRLTHEELTIEFSPVQISTGLAKHPDCVLIKSEGDQLWQYIGLYGPQSLAGDQLGTAVFYKKNDLAFITEDKQSQIVVFKPAIKVEYYFAAAWEGEAGGIQNIDEFKQYLLRQTDILSQPAGTKIK